jgi:hypothetical protein
MWIGSTTDPNCVAVGASNCTNHDSFVFTQQVQFGNSNLVNSNTVTVGSPSSAIVNNYGVIQSPTYVTDSRAALPSASQSAMQTLWAANNGTGQKALSDGQVMYLVETYFQSPDLSVSALAGNGVYARYFM